ncbi:MAG: hypothetical protein Q4C98_02435 [Capnocytophaga sp.]|nr:hypothetical protein [Capnocytophaga sp.]
MIKIIDAKLSQTTSWTTNQKAAQKMSGWRVKTTGEIIKGSDILDRNTTVIKKQDFIRIYKDNGIIKID